VGFLRHGISWSVQRDEDVIAGVARVVPSRLTRRSTAIVGRRRHRPVLAADGIDVRETFGTSRGCFGADPTRNGFLRRGVSVPLTGRPHRTVTQPICEVTLDVRAESTQGHAVVPAPQGLAGPYARRRSSGAHTRAAFSATPIPWVGKRTDVTSKPSCAPHRGLDRHTLQ
jgi:hypothetical protein